MLTTNKARICHKSEEKYYLLDSSYFVSCIKCSEGVELVGTCMHINMWCVSRWLKI